jgi:hypothetical protein
MSIAITEDHQSLAKTADDFLHRRDARGSARALLEAKDEALPSWWGELIELGWRDAERRHDEIVAFFDALLDGREPGTTSRLHGRRVPA